MRLINEDDVLEIIERVTNEAVEKKQPKYLIQPRIIAEISGLPTIEAETVKHGRWEINCDGYYPYCSNCKNEPQGREMTLYCPNCGAKLIKDGDINDTCRSITRNL